MSISKDLTVSITNESEGCVLVIKTVSAIGEKSVSISGDLGVYDIKELEKALDEVAMFHLLNKQTQNLTVASGQ